MEIKKKERKELSPTASEGAQQPCQHLDSAQ